MSTGIRANPFQVLGVKPGDSKAVILQAVTKKMQEKGADLKKILECQKILFDPETYAAARFLFSIDHLKILHD